MELICFFKRSQNNKESDVKLAKAKNQEAFIILIQENLTSMYRVARGILNTKQDIEDAIQNTTLIALNKIHTLRDDKLFKTWIIRVLINECNKIYKYNKKSIKEVVEDTYTIDTSSNIDLYNAISSLSDELRVSTILFYFDELTYKEISNVLRVPEGTVKSRVFRAKQGLYEMLKDNVVSDYSTGRLVNKFKYELPSEDGELMIVPYRFKDWTTETLEDVLREFKLQEQSKMDLGQYGSMEIEKIEFREHETLMTIKTKGYVSLDPFGIALLYDDEENYYYPISVNNREVYSFMEMKADYIFKPMDIRKEYSFVYCEQTGVEILEDEIIKIR